MDADHVLIFWNCTKTNRYLENVNAIVKNVLGYNIPNTYPMKYLWNTEGVVKRGDPYLTKVLLTASKKAIAREWLNIDTPNRNSGWKLSKTY